MTSIYTVVLPVEDSASATSLAPSMDSFTSNDYEPELAAAACGHPLCIRQTHQKPENSTDPQTTTNTSSQQDEHYQASHPRSTIIRQTDTVDLTRVAALPKINLHSISVPHEAGMSRMMQQIAERGQQSPSIQQAFQGTRHTAKSYRFKSLNTIKTRGRSPKRFHMRKKSPQKGHRDNMTSSMSQKNLIPTVHLHLPHVEPATPDTGIESNANTPIPMFLKTTS